MRRVIRMEHLGGWKEESYTDGGVPWWWWWCALVV